MIPKIIHYCWLSNDPVPEDLQTYMKSWKEKLPEYEFIKWDFNRFEKSSSVWVSEAFDNKKYAFAADYIRLYAIYNYGGIYMDMDIEVIKSFNPLLDSEYMMAYERPNQPWIEAGCFGAEKGNEFIGDCLKRYENRHFIKEDGSYDQLPLPQVMAKVLKDSNLYYSFYSWDYFTAKSYDTGIETPSDNTFAIHHFAGSWKTDEEKMKIEKSRKLAKYFGVKIANNIVELSCEVKKYGIKGIKTYIDIKVENRKKSSGE